MSSPDLDSNLPCARVHTRPPVLGGGDAAAAGGAPPAAVPPGAGPAQATAALLPLRSFRQLLRLDLLRCSGMVDGDLAAVASLAALQRLALPCRRLSADGESSGCEEGRQRMVRAA
eukprot:298332-Chlamydomonas_euryale.AAC.6